MSTESLRRLLELSGQREKYKVVTKGVRLHVKEGGKEVLTLRLEGMMSMRPMVTTLRASGVDDRNMSYSDDEHNHAPVAGLDMDSDDMDSEDMGSIDSIEGPEAESDIGSLLSAVEKLASALGDEEELPMEVQDAIAKASAYLIPLADMLGGDDMDADMDDDMDDDMDADMDIEMEGANPDKKLGRQKAKSWGRPNSKERRTASKAVRKSAKSDIKSQVTEGGPLAGHAYHKKSDDELKYIMKDAGEAAKKMKGMDDKAEAKYLDQVNDAATVLHSRKGKTEGVDDNAEMDESAKGRARDTKITPSLSQGENLRNKKAMNSKERQDAKKDMKVQQESVDDIVARVMGKSLTTEGATTYAGWKAGIKKKHGSEIEWEGDKDICNAFVTKDGKRKGVGEWDGAQGEIYEAAVSANLFINSDNPANAVDDMDQKAERTGEKDRTATKVKVPADVKKAIDQRITELKRSMKQYDDKGYNDTSVKTNAIDCLEQIKRNLSSGDLEGFMEAQIFFGTLMSPIWDLFPAQLVNYLAKGDDNS